MNLSLNARFRVEADRRRAVVPANVDIATQEIIQMAEDADPDRKRTLAVLTKPDLVDRGAEKHVSRTASEKSRS